MLCESHNTLNDDAHSQAVCDGRVRIQESTSYDEVKRPNCAPMRQASTGTIDEMRKEPVAFSSEDGQEMLEVSLRLFKDWEAKRTRIEKEARQAKQKNESLTAAMRCGVCLEVLKNPQILDCGHSACYRCLLSKWTRPIDGSEDSIVSTDDEECEDEAVPRARLQFYSAVKRTKVCPTCQKVITRRPIPNLMLNDIVKTLHRSRPVPRRGGQIQGDGRGSPKDMWRGIFPAEMEHPILQPTNPEEVDRRRREETRQIRLELEENLERHYENLEETVVKINRLQVLISQERDEAIERWRSWVTER